MDHIQRILDRIEIWGTWRPVQHLKLSAMFLKPFPSKLCCYPTERGHCYQGIPLPCRDVPGSQPCLRRGNVTSAVHGPRVSQKNIAQNITLPPPCLLPTVHPGALSSPGKRRTRTWPSARKRDSSDQAARPVPTLACPLQVLSMVDRRCHGYSDCFAHNQQGAMHGVL